MTITLKSKKPANGVPHSAVYVHHVREYADDEEDFMYKQHGGTTIVYQYELLGSQKMGKLLAFRAAAAVCHHLDMYDRKKGVKLATERLNNNTAPFVVHGLVPTDIPAIELDFHKSGEIQIATVDGEEQDHRYFLDLIEEALAAQLQEEVWSNVYGPVNNPLQDHLDEDDETDTEVEEPADSTEPYDDDHTDDEDDIESDAFDTPVLVVVDGGASVDEEDEDEDDDKGASDGKPVTH